MKSFYRQVRYHWLTERIMYWWRKSPVLKVPAIDLSLCIDPGEVIIDCGANVGDVTSKFARTGATVYAFEPNPLCYAILVKRFGAMPMVHCFHNGVMNRRSTFVLRTPKPHGRWDAVETTVSASFESDATSLDPNMLQETEIECIDLDEFIRSLNRRVRLLKIDIEGSELPVLNHLIDTGTIGLVDLTVVETHEKQMPHLLNATNELRMRIAKEHLDEKIRLDWY